MDDLNSNHSNELCDNSDSWIPCWENQLPRTGGEINLVEDKEIASRAVAFVVNSTRKGIVPLCTDVANLLRAKRSLEKKVLLLTKENQALRSGSRPTSHSTSPTPASLSSDKSIIHDTSYHIQEPYRPPSRCSQCSSTVSDSPKVRQRPESQQRSPNSSRHSGTSPLSQRPDSLHGQQEPPVSTDGPLNETEVQKPTRNGLMTKAEVHVESKPTVHTSGHYDKHNIDKKNDRYHRISQKSKQIKYEVEDNRNNYDELYSLESTFDAEKDLKYITECLQQIEVKQCLDKLYIENELHSNPDNKVKGPKLYSGSKQKTQSVNKKWSRALSPSVTSVCSEPIKGCKCSRCESAVRSGDEDVNDAQKFSVSYKLQVQQGDYVVAKGDKTGRICYIGHLDNTPDVLYVGLELAQPVGQHDGFYKSKRYYTCKKDHGIFFPLQEILCKVNKKPSKLLKTPSREGKIEEVTKL
ncbi:uncharacterized protein LOC127717676 [Mytilus californianus]|uniref:uncharacterized protein LOC127717676 n=1 Tax=Mytilus californianus TaxID=6549 RepID=UPI002245AAB5|nr:uncharacterized protein LOC127717676 [Mytilus californianus]